MSAVHTTLITADELAGIIDRCALLDCRHDLFDPAKGQQEYQTSHLPGAHFVSIDRDLAGAKGDGRKGRHPLPDRDTLRLRLQSLGISDETQIIAYDADTGTYAARLWWLARWLGHEKVAVLEGGFKAWKAASYPTSPEKPAAPAAGNLTLRTPLEHPVTGDELLADQATRSLRVVDARAPERYRGDVEPLDPVAGHIPGALNRPLGLNLRPDGRFKPAQVLNDEFSALLAGGPMTSVVHSCGSGVSACHNLLAMRHAGLSGARLYAGSWSEWCADSSRPVAKGPAPG